MAQSRLESLLEAKLNMIAAFGISWAANTWAIPFLFGVKINAKQGFLMVIFFSVLSVIRQYCLRRLFEWKGRRNCKNSG